MIFLYHNKQSSATISKTFFVSSAHFPAKWKFDDKTQRQHFLAEECVSTYLHDWQRYWGKLGKKWISDRNFIANLRCDVSNFQRAVCTCKIACCEFHKSRELRALKPEKMRKHRQPPRYKVKQTCGSGNQTVPRKMIANPDFLWGGRADFHIYLFYILFKADEKAYVEFSWKKIRKNPHPNNLFIFFEWIPDTHIFCLALWR